MGHGSIGAVTRGLLGCWLGLATGGCVADRAGDGTAVGTSTAGKNSPLHTAAPHLFSASDSFTHMHLAMRAHIG